MAINKNLMVVAALFAGSLAQAETATFHINKILSNGAAVSAIFENHDLRAQYSRHYEIEKRICQGEAVQWLDLTTEVDRFDWTIVDENRVELKLAFNNSNVDARYYRKSPYTCLWYGGTALAELGRVELDMGLVVKIDDTGHFQANIQPKRFLLDGFHLKNIKLPRSLEGEIDQMVTKGTNWFFQSHLGKRFLKRLEDRINAYLKTEMSVDEILSLTEPQKGFLRTDFKLY